MPLGGKTFFFFIFGKICSVFLFVVFQQKLHISFPQDQNNEIFSSDKKQLAIFNSYTETIILTEVKFQGENVDLIEFGGVWGLPNFPFHFVNSEDIMT